METALPSAQVLIRLSKDHLSQRLGVPAGEITLVEVTAATWKDASLGCPKPGIDYIRIEIPGYSVVLESGGTLYTYHTDQAQRVLPCGSRAGGAASPTP